MTRHLHHHGVHPLFEHDRQQRLELGCFRRGQSTLLLTAVDPDADGTDQPSHPIRGAQAGLDQIGGGRLAGRAGHTDDAQMIRRPTVDGGGDFSQYRARLRMHHYRHRQAVTPGDLGDAVLVGQHRHRTALDSLCRVAGPVRSGPRQRSEQITRLRVLAPQCDAGEQNLRKRSGIGRHRGDQTGQRAERQTDGMAGAQIHGFDTVPTARAAHLPVATPARMSARLKRQPRTRITRERHVLTTQQPGRDVVEQRGGR